MVSTLRAGDEVELTVEKPAAGGRMLARHEREVVLVLGAIPGERVRARIERAERQVAFATMLNVLDPSPDRRTPAVDLTCGGCLFAHIDYARQVALKGEIIQDAFVRLAKIPLAEPIAVAPSPTRGYRLRARLHVRNGRAGFYREGTHELCDAAPTGQLSDGAVASAMTAVDLLARAGHAIAAVELAENVAADERVFAISPSPGADVTDSVLDDVVRAAGLTGCVGRDDDGVVHTSGVPVVSDPLPLLTDGRAAEGVLQRHAESFFQANRFLLPKLVTSVLDAVSNDGPVIDLYAGVGLFSIALASTGRSSITAVEGDRTSGRDLQRNAVPFSAHVRAVVESVEDYLRKRNPPRAATVIVDPPRTGISRAAMEQVVASRATRVVYVSCDPPTMARDARRLVDGGYQMTSLAGFDLFPNTPHVESVGVFDFRN